MSASTKKRIPVATAVRILVLISPVFLWSTIGNERKIEKPMRAENRTVWMKSTLFAPVLGLLTSTVLTESLNGVINGATASRS